MLLKVEETVSAFAARRLRAFCGGLSVNATGFSLPKS